MGSLYLLFAIHAGVDGTLFSLRVRIELALPFVHPDGLCIAPPKIDIGFAVVQVGYAPDHRDAPQRHRRHSGVDDAPDLGLATKSWTSGSL